MPLPNLANSVGFKANVDSGGLGDFVFATAIDDHRTPMDADDVVDGLSYTVYALRGPAGTRQVEASVVTWNAGSQTFVRDGAIIWSTSANTKVAFSGQVTVVLTPSAQDLLALAAGGGGGGFVMPSDLEQDLDTTTGLFYGYKAGTINRSSGIISIGAGTIELPPDISSFSPVFVYVDPDGNVAFGSDQFVSGIYLMAQVTTSSTDVAGVIDRRALLSVPYAGELLGAAILPGQSPSPFGTYIEIYSTNGTAGEEEVDYDLGNTLKPGTIRSFKLTNKADPADNVLINFGMTVKQSGSPITDVHLNTVGDVLIAQWMSDHISVVDASPGVVTP